jgi:cytochrome c556
VRKLSDEIIFFKVKLMKICTVISLQKFSFIVLLVSGFTPLLAQAQFARIDDAVKYRQAAFQILSTHVSRIGAMVKAESPLDKAALESNAAIIELISRQVWHAFPAGSDTAMSKSKSEIWKEADKFKASAENMQAEVGRLTVASKTGDLALIKSTFGALTQTCKSCHDNYRNR